MPYPNRSVINIGDWISQRSCLQPRKRALIFEGRPFTYQEVNLHTSQLCHSLLALGVEKGDRVSILLYNGTQYLEIFFALSKIGAIRVPLNGRLAGPELKAFVVLKLGDTMGNGGVFEFLKGSVAKYKIQKVVEVVVELPKTASDKIQKSVLDLNLGGVHD
jgi:acyl-CoA synthetase (AMP-forming)/AMP-acid ligase II